MEASVHTLVTDVIEVAADGKSARAFITPWCHPLPPDPRGEKYCNVLWERYGSDFVCEDGEWKYLHEHVCPDIWASWIHQLGPDEYARITSPDPGEAMQPTLGDPPRSPIPGPLHMPYSVLKPPEHRALARALRDHGQRQHLYPLRVRSVEKAPSAGLACQQ